ncbi:hypothetical protein [Heyndrickxia sporothermodurans]|uniref:hypothetical protein n=1 Tax=Heyndrickxia sporothermodurans TaxID=46224 RepID=UPI002E246087|nr:hypothetical protein [Bacillus thuringiensis]
MDNKKMLDTAIEMLQQLSIGDIETVQIDNTNYDDDSVRFTVDVMYPAKDDK